MGDSDDKSVILTSAVKKVEVASYESLVSFFEGDLQAGTQVLGLAENGVGIPESNPNVSAEVLAEADKVTASIIDGSVVAPDTVDEAKAATSAVTIIGEM